MVAPTADITSWPPSASCPDDCGDCRACLRAAAARHASASDSWLRASERALTRLGRWARDHALARSVLVVDDSGPALLALVASLAPLGVPVHAVGHAASPELRAAVEHLGARMHETDCCGDAVEAWERERCAVVVVDVRLDGDACGAQVLDRIGRGPRAVLVTSHHGDGDALDAAARAADAVPLVRTDTGAWQERLRDEVLKLLDDAAPATE